MTTYSRVKYACQIHVRRDRMTWDGRDYVLSDAERVSEVMGRWLARGLRDRSAVMGTAQVRIRDWTYERPPIVASVPVYLDVAPEHVEMLMGIVDDDKGACVQVDAS